LSPAAIEALLATGVITVVGGSILYMASSSSDGGGGGRRSNNQSENRKFREAVRRIESETGHKLSKDDLQRLHRDISKQGLTMEEIVEWGVTLFGG
jgi:tRNA A37 N6-isopentenylltransferase MiaA